jgi:hypothetical protein
MASVPRRPRWVAVRPSWPAALARMARPPPRRSLREARHSLLRRRALWPGSMCPMRAGPAIAGRPGDAADRRQSAREACSQRSARRACCGEPRGVRRVAAGVAVQQLRQADTSAGRKAHPAELEALTPKAEGPQCALGRMTPAARRAERGPRSAGGAQAAQQSAGPKERPCSNDTHHAEQGPRGAVGAQATRPRNTVR